MTFYRKYRPQLIEELDNEEIRKRLSAVLSSKSLPHAFLFSGPKGIGKTSAARIIAKAINCGVRRKELEERSQKKHNIEPCNQCDICRSITNGTSLDILEIDGASSRGIDEVRDLREKIKLAPSFSKYKVYIIDEVHMLTMEAFNALLKTLEEPPAHAVFILCTTEPKKLPETIISRCLRFDFKRANINELKRSLKRIVAGEEFKIDDAALNLIAKASDGSFREAAKILEQLSFEEKKITVDNVSEFLGKTKINQATEFLKFLTNRDTKGAILWINSAFLNGADLKIITSDLLEILRNYLIKKTADIENEEIDYGESYQKLTVPDIFQLIKIFSQAYFEFKTTTIPALPLELGVVEWSQETSFSQKTQEPLKTGQEKSFNSDKSESPKEKVKLNSKKSKGKIDFDKVVSFWPEILTAIKPLNHSVHAVLRGARPLTVEENFLIIEAFYKFHKERLEEPKVNALLCKVIGEKLDCEIGVKCILGEKKTKDQEPKAKNNKDENDKKPAISMGDTDEDLIKVAEEIFK